MTRLSPKRSAAENGLSNLHTAAANYANDAIIRAPNEALR